MTQIQDPEVEPDPERLRPVDPASEMPGRDLVSIHALPADDTRATRAGIVMCEALEAFDATGADRWQMLVGATLPILRNEAWVAFRNERAQTEESRR